MQWLLDIARQNPELTITSLQRINSLLSDIYSPPRTRLSRRSKSVRDAELPRKAPRGNPTHAYELDEIDQIFKALLSGKPASTVIAGAAFAGLRRGKICGVRREDYNADTAELRVVRAVWEGHVSDPKTQDSIGVVPVIAPLQARLDPRVTRPNVSG
jgi:integrase